MGAVITLPQGGRPALASHRPSMFNSAAQAGVQASFAVIGYKGRVWSTKYRGETEILKGDNGAPVPYLDVVVVGVSEHVSKQFYADQYVEGSDAAPDCFSLDGITPDASAPKKQCASCAMCPNNQWGSRMTNNGKKGKACQDARRIAVVPYGDLENETYGGPMMLRIPPMSLNNLASYAGMLERNGAGMEYVATRLGFEYDVAYPQITFNAVGWLSDEEATEVVGSDGNGGICANPLIDRMLRDSSPETPVSNGVSNGLPPGGPASVFNQAAPTPAPLEPTRPVPDAGPAPGHVNPAQAAPAPQPSKRRSAFSAPTQVVAPPSIEPTHAVAGAPVQTTQAPPAVITQVEQAPEDMQSAIDRLLDMPA
jgi:hypothetical protein